MSKVKEYPSKEFIETKFLYKEGLLINKRTGKSACYNTKKYTMVYIKGALYSAHRLIWILHNNDSPKNDLDHINRNKHDNRIENLRSVSRSVNAHNSGNRSNSLCKGVSYRPERGNWRSYIMVLGVMDRLGTSSTFFEACCLRKSAELRLCLLDSQI